ncbi:YciI family protein [uncultured Pelagimonas sp.]|uniref:YciI family protein n=1 Tax=uncultured Pelagimonas sp. TaxID=1618102 RepID=UPI00260A6CEC|nr:YciI family protein [uncultured Pelagimonas sp.]
MSVNPEPVIPEGHNLFAIDITYNVPLSEVDPHIDAHMAFIAKGYAEGRFLASGAKVPRTGGMIIAIGAERSEIEALMAQDPFTIAGVVALQITEFKAANVADILK